MIEKNTYSQDHFVGQNDGMTTNLEEKRMSPIKIAVMLVITMATLLIPGLRRFVIHRLIRSRLIKHFALQFIFSLPIVREKLQNVLRPLRS